MPLNLRRVLEEPWNIRITRCAILSSSILLLAFSTLFADIIDQTGSVPIPGSNDLVDYRITVRPFEDGRLGVWMRLTNPSPRKAISFMACPMVSIKENTNQQRRFDLVLFNGVYDCADKGLINRLATRNFHFGCRRYTLPAAGSEIAVSTGNAVNPPLVTHFYPKVSDNALTIDDVANALVDVLADEPLGASCTALRGANRRLVPALTGAVRPNATWGGPSPGVLSEIESAEPLDAPRFLGEGSFFVFAPNTLAAPAPATVRMRGLLSGAPPGTIFSVQVPTGDEDDTADASGIVDPAGVGSFAFLYTLFPNLEKMGTIEFITPEGTPIPSGTLIRFQAEVVVEIPFVNYQAGDFLFNIHNSWMRDDGEPLIRVSQTTPTSGNRLLARVTASDDLTLATRAAVRFSVDGGQSFQNRPMGFGDRDIAGLTTFEELLGPFDNPSQIQVQFEVSDELDNFSLSPLSRIEPVRTLFFPQFGNGQGLVSDIVLINSATTGGPSLSSIDLRDPDGFPLDLGYEGGDPGAIEIDPSESVTLRTDGMGALVVGSATVTSKGPVEGLVRFTIPGFGVAGVPSGASLKAAAVPVRNEGGVRTALAIRNTGSAPLVLEVSLTLEPNQQLEGQILLGVAGQAARFIDEVFTELQGRQFSGTAILRSGAGSFAAVALEQGPGVFTTLPVVPLE